MEYTLLSGKKKLLEGNVVAAFFWCSV